LFFIFIFNVTKCDKPIGPKFPDFVHKATRLIPASMKTSTYTPPTIVPFSGRYFIQLRADNKKELNIIYKNSNNNNQRKNSKKISKYSSALSKWR